MTRRREVYARAATQLRTHERAYAAEAACPGALGLYLFALLHARGEETAGDVPAAVLLCAWGGSRAYRQRQADALVAAGLLELRGDRYQVTRYEEHNDTPDVIAANRESVRERKRASRRTPHVTPHVTRDSRGTAASVPISISISPSGSDLDQGIGDRGSGTPPTPAEAPADEVPAWFVEACATVSQALGREVDDVPARWLEYSARSERKGWAMGHRDAVGWLSQVLRAEGSRTRLARTRGGPVQGVVDGAWEIPEGMP